MRQYGASKQLQDALTEAIVGIAVSTMTGDKYFLSGLTNVHCRLIFTTERLVVQRTNTQTRQNYPNYRIDPSLAKILIERGIQSLLAESPHNLSIPYSTITKVELGRRWLNPRMNIVTKDAIHRFTWFWPAGTNGVERVIRYHFPIEIPVERVKKI